MKILITSQFTSQNTYVSDIVLELSKLCEVVTEPQNFWSSNLQFDIIHIQWPEELFGWKSITEDDLVKLKNRIYELKNRQIKIVTTLHNQLPHRRQKLDKELYDLVYSNSDCIINLGEYSKRIYPKSRNVVIFHPNYSNHFIPKPSSEDKKIFFSFGAIRSKQEEEQIIEGFLKANITNSILIVANSIIGENPYKRKKHTLQRVLYSLKIKKLLTKRIKLISKRLSEAEIEYYFNQASVIVSPRIDNLNSGVVVMGFTFGKVVIGPAIGNINEILSYNNNPIFLPLNTDSIANAMREAINSSEIGEKNKKFSDDLLCPKKIANQHFLLYKDLLQ